VEIAAEGPGEVLEEFITLCWQGPPAARVEDVHCRWEEALGDWESFQIRYS
jgi:acylphosphatase